MLNFSNWTWSFIRSSLVPRRSSHRDRPLAIYLYTILPCMGLTLLLPPSAQADSLPPPAACPCEPSDTKPASVLQVQGTYIQQGDEATGQARVFVSYPITDYSNISGALEFTEGNALSTSAEGLRIQELYYDAQLPGQSNVNVTVGKTDLTSHFDRNSFAKDGTTHFFNSTLQSNPALVNAGMASRPAAVARWRATDGVILKGAVFSSDADLTELGADGVAAEVGVWRSNTLVRATYVTGEDRGADTVFQEGYSLLRSGGQTGVKPGDREHALGLNAETYFPSKRLGAFARYGWYHNSGLGESAQTYSAGLNALDVWRDQDRLGLAYGRDLSNERLRKQQGQPVPDVVEVFYDTPVTPNLRAGITLQQRQGFSETVLGFRIKANFMASPIERLFQ